jgi:hypothetical protein
MMAIKTTTAITKKYMMDSLIVMVTVLSTSGRDGCLFKTEHPVPRCVQPVGEPFLLLYPIRVNRAVEAGSKRTTKQASPSSSSAVVRQA